MQPLLVQFARAPHSPFPMADRRGVVPVRLMVGMLTLASVTIGATGIERRVVRRAHARDPRAAFAAVFSAGGAKPRPGSLRCCGSAPALSPASRPGGPPRDDVGA